MKGIGLFYHNLYVTIIIIMSEIKRTILRMGFYYLLFAINSVFCIGFFANNFFTRNLPTIYLLVLVVCLIFYYCQRVSPKEPTSFLIKSIAWMALLLILFRGIKYSAFSNIDILSRHTWYFYYVPILLMPLSLFYISLLVSKKQNTHLSKIWIWPFVLTVVFIVLILTNDLHQQVFQFQEGFKDWNYNYEHGWLFYLIMVWQYSIYFAAIIILIIKCRVISSKKNSWLILIPAFIGAILYILLLIGLVPKIGGSPIIEFPETHVFTVVIVVECCMQLGLVPTNNEYGKIFQNLSISAQITDKKGKPIFISSNATPINNEQFALKNGSRIGEHSILYKMELPGGYGFWQDDMEELDRINEELLEAKEGLKQEAELIRLRNELLVRQTKIAQRTILYDEIAQCTQRQSQKISELATKALKSNDPELKDECRKEIVLLGAYIKRYANLTLLSQENTDIELGELKVSISELLHYLNYYGIPGEFVGEAKTLISAKATLVIFETLELIIENNIQYLKGIFVNLFVDDNITIKLIVENMHISLDKKSIYALNEAGITMETTKEDDIAYLTFNVPKGEKTI